MTVTTLPLYPVVIGVTGHRDIAPWAEAKLRQTVRTLLADWLNWFEPALHVLTSLADGADQLVAEEALALGIPIIAVSPMPLPRYRVTLTHPEKFDACWSKAVLTLTLPELPGPGLEDPEIADPEEAGSPGEDYNKRHFEQLGVLLARRSHLLLALWDGDRNTDRGGTAEVARMRLEGDHGAAAFATSPMFLGADSLLDMTWRGPLLQVVTPRGQAEAGKAGAGEAGTCALMGLPEPLEREPDARADAWHQIIPVEPAQVFGELHRRHVRDFDFIRELNGQIASFSPPDRKIFARQFGYLNLGGISDPNATVLKRLQAAADTAAQAWQVKLMGNFVPASSPREMLNNAHKFWRNTGRFPKVGAAFVFAAAVPVAVLWFEIFVHNAHNSLGRLSLLIYVLIFAGTGMFYLLVVAPDHWQSRFQDYRALAEAMRVQLYWAGAAVPAAVSDHYLRKQSGELGWIQFALRGPALWAAALADKLKVPDTAAVKTGWIDDQRDYFGKKSPMYEEVERRGRFRTLFLARLALAVSVILLIVDWNLIPMAADGTMSNMIEMAHDPFVVFAATLPALAAFFSLSAELRAYEPHAHSYGIMFRLFNRAAKEVERREQDDKAFQALVRELGREALAENAEWLVDHRHRKIEQRQ